MAAHAFTKLLGGSPVSHLPHHVNGQDIAWIS
jgi:hypothetical protein